MARSRTIPLIYLTSFLFLFGESIQPSPRIAIYESVSCRQYYDSQGTNIGDCKVPAVQEELSLLIGMERLSIIIPSILAIPFAALADRVGHSTVLSVAIFGVLLEDFFPLIITWFDDIFPIRLIWLHFIFSLVGGGFTVVVTLLHVIIAHIVEEEQRTAVFFRIRAAGVAASVLGYAASGLLMKWNNWLPWIVGLSSLAAATLTAWLVPITRAKKNHIAASGSSDIQSVDTEGSWFNKAARSINHVLKVLGGNRHLPVMLVLVFLCQLGFDAVPLMLAIYISKRFGWTFADVSGLLPVWKSKLTASHLPGKLSQFH
jgi:MFS family permease